MITSITIENFKGIRERVQLDLRPITLLFGANSAGKSTILHALLYASEFFLNGNLDVDETTIGGKLVDLGGFEKLKHSGGNVDEVALELKIRRDENVWPDQGIPDFPDDGYYASEEILCPPGVFSMEVRIAWNSFDSRPFVRECVIAFDHEVLAEITAQSGRPNVNMRLNVQHPNFIAIQDCDLIKNLIGEYLGEYNEDTAELSAIEILLTGGGRESLPDVCADEKWIEIEVLGTNALPENVWAACKFETGSEIADEYLQSLLVATLRQVVLSPVAVIQAELKKFRYIGPVRQTPTRNYSPSRSGSEQRWASGLAAWDLLHYRGREFIEEASLWLRDEGHLNAGCGLELKESLELDLSDPAVVRAFENLDGLWTELTALRSSLPTERKVLISPNQSNARLTPCEVGVGISQILPIVVSAIDSEPRLQTIEQPELHLHPQVQANLGDLFIENFHTKGHHFIIETHSEHLILRLLRRIRETEVNKAPINRSLRTDELAIYYLKQEEGSSRAIQIDVDVKGEFTRPWPDDFFEIDFYERFPDAR